MKAFTLVETLVVVGLLAAIGSALSGMIVYFYRSNAYVLEQSAALDSAKRGLEISFENIREASYGEDGAYPLASAATSSVTFFSEVDADGSIEKVRVYLLGTGLYRGVTNPTGNPPTYTGQPETTYTIATSVRNATSTPIFRYFDADGVELTGTIDVAAVASVQTRLDVDLNPLRAPNIMTLERTTTLRNLRD